MTAITVQRYQWIKGDNQGNVEIYQGDSGNFNVFAGGGRCNKDLMDEYMIPIFDDAEILNFGDVQDEELVQKAKDKSKRSAMTRGILSEDDPKSKVIQAPVKTESIQKPKEDTNSPLVSLISKSKKTKIKLNTRIDMELPSKEVLSVLQESFDDDILDLI